MSLTLREILDGVELALKDQWPTWPVYRNRRPQKFDRHSFLLQGGPIDHQNVGGGQRQVDCTVRLDYFPPVNDHGNSSPDDLEESVDALLDLFELGYVKAGDRRPHVLKATGGYGYDYVSITAVLRFHDVIVTARTGDAAQALMQNVHTKFEQE